VIKYIDMKTILTILLTVIAISGYSQTGRKLKNMTNETSVDGTELLYVVDGATDKKLVMDTLLNIISDTANVVRGELGDSIAQVRSEIGGGGIWQRSGDDVTFVNSGDDLGLGISPVTGYTLSVNGDHYSNGRILSSSFMSDNYYFGTSFAYGIFLVSNKLKFYDSDYPSGINLVDLASGYFTLSGNDLVPNSTSYNQLLGISTNPSGYKLYVNGESSLTGDINAGGDLQFNGAKIWASGAPGAEELKFEDDYASITYTLDNLALGTFTKNYNVDTLYFNDSTYMQVFSTGDFTLNFGGSGEGLGVDMNAGEATTSTDILNLKGFSSEPNATFNGLYYRSDLAELHFKRSGSRDTIADREWVRANAGGGSSISFGSNNQIPHMNSGGTDFDYSVNLTYDGTRLNTNAIDLNSGTNTLQWSTGESMGGNSDNVYINADAGEYFYINGSDYEFRITDTAISVYEELLWYERTSGSADTFDIIAIDNGSYLRFDTAGFVAAGWNLKSDFKTAREVLKDQANGELVWGYLGTDGKMYYPRNLNAMYATQQLQAAIEMQTRQIARLERNINVLFGALLLLALIIFSNIWFVKK
jgi:hypothetical protein